MRTLFLTQDFPPDHGGIARLYGELCARFPAGGVEVCTVRVAEKDADPAVSSDASALYPIERLPFTFREARRLGSLLRWTHWTGRRLARGDIDLLQVGNIRPTGYVAAWHHARCGVPYVLYVHGKDLMKEERKTARSRRARRTGRWVLAGAAALIANSRATAERAERLLESLDIDPTGKVCVVHPGTDPARFRPDAPGADVWRERLDLQGRRVLLSVSRLMARKGIDTALEALARVAPVRPDIVHVIAGDGPERARLEGLAAELRVSDRVRFLGAVDDAELPALYAAADIFVLPIREEPDDDEVEGFGIVFCEAAAAGLPVIAGNSGGVADAVRDGETAFLVPPRDADATAAALVRLLDDAELRRAMGRAGREAVESYYHWGRAAAEAWAVLEAAARRGEWATGRRAGAGGAW